MIGTIVIFDVQEPDGWVAREGIIKDKIRMPNARAISNVIDHYIILSKKKYYFIECSAVGYKDYTFKSKEI